MHCAECERPVFMPQADGRYRVHAFCCKRCEVDYYSREQRLARALDPRPCVECGETFQPKRKDAMYCGAACKQRAYRKRATP